MTFISQMFNRKQDAIPNDYEFMAMCDSDVIQFCRKNEKGWVHIPRVRFNDHIARAIIEAHPSGVLALFRHELPNQEQHILASLQKWKSKTFNLIGANHLPQDENLIIAIIRDNPVSYSSMPKKIKTPAMVDVAICLDHKLIDDTPEQLITNEHILHVLNVNPEFLPKMQRTPACTLKQSTIERLFNEAPLFLNRFLDQLNKEQLFRLANEEPGFWISRSHVISHQENMALIHRVLVENTSPGTGARFLSNKLSELRKLHPQTLARKFLEEQKKGNFVGPSALMSDLYLTALDFNDQALYSKHVEAIPELLPHYQQTYGSDAAMQVAKNPSQRREILDHDLNL